MTKSFRPPSVIEEQIADMEQIIPHRCVPLADDFAAHLQIASWTHHLSELNVELEASREYHLPASGK